MINEYSLVKSESVFDLAAMVNEQIKYGWQPFGGVSASLVKLNKVNMPDENGRLTYMYVQALVK